jgi:hypothetical protein
MLIIGARRRTPATWGVERALELAGEVAHVGAGAAHVEADHAPVPGGLRRARHADDAAGRAGEDGVPCPGSAAPRPGRRCSA